MAPFQIFPRGGQRGQHFLRGQDPKNKSLLTMEIGKIWHKLSKLVKNWQKWPIMSKYWSKKATTKKDPKLAKFELSMYIKNRNSERE